MAQPALLLRLSILLSLAFDRPRVEVYGQPGLSIRHAAHLCFHEYSERNDRNL